MIRWREGKAGFIGASKRLIKGVFTYSYQIATTFVQVIFPGAGIQSTMDIDGGGVNSLADSTGGGISSKMLTGSGLSSVMSTEGVGVDSQMDATGSGINSKAI